MPIGSSLSVVTELRLASSQCIIRALAFCHIDDCSDNLHKFSASGEKVTGSRFNMSDRSRGYYDSVCYTVVSFFAQCALYLVRHSVSLMWMDALPHLFNFRRTLQRIKPED